MLTRNLIGPLINPWIKGPPGPRGNSSRIRIKIPYL